MRGYYAMMCIPCCCCAASCAGIWAPATIIADRQNPSNGDYRNCCCDAYADFWYCPTDFFFSISHLCFLSSECCGRLCYHRIESMDEEDSLHAPTIDEAAALGGGSAVVASVPIDIPAARDEKGDDLNLGISVSLPSAPLPPLDDLRPIP